MVPEQGLASEGKRGAVQGGPEAGAGAAEAGKTEPRPDVIGAGPVVLCGQACLSPAGDWSGCSQKRLFQEQWGVRRGSAFPSLNCGCLD